MKKTNKGITLVALVVTIVILLILAGISLNLILGENGLVTKSNEGRTNYTRASEEEQEMLDGLEEEIMGYMGEAVPGSPADIASNAAENYGKYVTNYTAGWEYIKGVTEETKGTSWKIFYAGKLNSDETKSHIYLIASDYIHYTGMPTVTVGGETKKAEITYEEDAQTKTYPYRGNFVSVNAGYSENASAIGSEVKYLNKNYFDYISQSNVTGTNYNNIQSIAYMLDIGKWSTNYKTNGIADWAIGGPSLELFIASYNNKYNTNLTAGSKDIKDINNDDTISTEGYTFSEEKVNYTKSSGGITLTNNSLYMIGSPNTDNAFAYYFSSPQEGGPNLQGVNFYQGLYFYSNNLDMLGFRPVVRLNSNVKLEADGDNFKIVGID